MLKRAGSNNKEDRVRPENNQKDNAIQLPKKQQFAQEHCAFGRAWGRKVKGNEWATPTFREMMEGVFRWYSQQSKEKLKGKPEMEQKKIMQRRKKTWNELMKAANITRVDEPLKKDN